MNCEMCGKEGELFKTIIEGTELIVCSSCAKHGKVLKSLRPIIEKKKEEKKIIKEKKPEITEKLISDYGRKIRKARVKKDMTQEKFARQLNIKESLLTKIENSSFKPSIPLARKLEKLLKIKLVEETAEEKIQITKGETEAVTIGDLIKFK
ncbi:TIGR00270 family protein [Candidatus Woesearchaeota archaeon]|nr:TIGR00270 family protein [Candidatus Woesearchaeota archaeon]